MSYFRQLLRLYTIYQTLVNHGLDEIIQATHLFPWLRYVFYLTPGYWTRQRHLPRGARIRMALEQLGPIFVKFGQILSTRRDLLPDDIAWELAKLQDNVPPFPTAEVLDILEKAYGRPAREVFAHFDETPLAAASIAQVHGATLQNGKQVVVKIVRPGILPRIQRDLEVLFLLARLAQQYWPDGRRLHPVDVVEEYEKNLHDELDLLREAANCATLRRNFEGSELLYVPEVEWDYTRRNVMVLERISGIPVSNLAFLKQQNVNFKFLAESGVEVFFTQVFRDNFFHADMHPGNIFVDPTNRERPRYIAVDFGIMGTLSSEDQRYLAENFLAFFHRDYRRVAELHVQSEWVPAGTKIEEFEGAIRSVCEPVFNKPIKEISFGLFLLRLFQTARRFNMEVQPQLVLLQKTLLNIEGLGRQVYPDLDLWQTAKPFLERWMSERVGWRAVWRGVQNNAPFWLEHLPEAPMLAYEAVQAVKRQEKMHKETLKEVQALRREIATSHQRSQVTMAGGAMLISSSMILAFDMLYVANIAMFGTILGVVGLALLVMNWLDRD